MPLGVTAQSFIKRKHDLWLEYNKNKYKSINISGVKKNLTQYGFGVCLKHWDDNNKIGKGQVRYIRYKPDYIPGIFFNIINISVIQE